MQHNETVIGENLLRVREEIARNAEASGRCEDDITLIAVCKYVDSKTTEIVVRHGCGDVGENRPQTLWKKATELEQLPVRFHQIGHLQRNKVRRTVGLISLLHAGDSLRLLRSVSEESGKQEIRTNVLLEVNLSGDESKHGFAGRDLSRMVDEVGTLPHIKVCGLMGMSGLRSNPNQTAREYESLRKLRDKLRQNSSDNVELNELSMGMSRDFGLAIRQGATMVRVGSALFQGVG